MSDSFAILIFCVKFRYTASRFQQLNEYIYNLLKNIGLKDDAGERNVLILIGQQKRRIEDKEYRQHMWAIM